MRESTFFSVIPANAGIQRTAARLDTRFRGYDEKASSPDEGRQAAIRERPPGDQQFPVS
jgi:hypothetical protein